MHQSNYLLTCDLHLTDSESESYRWQIFDSLKQLALPNRVDYIYILGDLVDRKDRHSGILLNRMVSQLNDLTTETGAKVIISMGNHDCPLNGPPYWSFLNSTTVQYVTQPTMNSEVLVLPFSPNPVADWAELDLSGPKALFMHQTLAGSLVEGNRRITEAPHPLPLFPRGVSIYSGDVHRPQTIGNVTYIGAPHPVRFSETWENRLLLITKSDFKNPHAINLKSIRRAILDITDVNQLMKVKFERNDQLKIRYALSAAKMTRWPEEEQKIREWAHNRGITLASVEAQLTEEIDVNQPCQTQGLELMRPRDVIIQFGNEEGLASDVIAVGERLLETA